MIMPMLAAANQTGRQIRVQRSSIWCGSRTAILPSAPAFIFA